VNETRVLTLAPAVAAALEQRLRRDLPGEAEWRRVDHARFAVKLEGTSVVCYRSGKLVVQGQDLDAFTARWLADLPLDGPGAEAAAPSIAFDAPTIGSDEAGKGDYFGPLVVAAAVVAPEQAPALLRAGVRDCKQMSDPAILRAAKVIRDLCPHEVLALSPEEYNRRHEAEGNVALFLADMHAKAIAAAVRSAPSCERVVIDQFTHEERLEKALLAEGVRLPVEIRHRAEDNPAVAAASVLARAEFLLGLRELGNEHGLELPKGAGEPVVVAGRGIFRAGGMAALSSVAKTHFKTTRRVTGELF
jgi:ribonuclease HIII